MTITAFSSYVHLNPLWPPFQNENNVSCQDPKDTVQLGSAPLPLAALCEKRPTLGFALLHPSLGLCTRLSSAT